MKNFFKMFFKKLWAILVHVVYCLAPYFYYLQKAADEVEDEKQPKPDAEEPTKKTE